MSNIHITAKGDMFDTLALQYFDDEKLASVIIQANPDYSDVLIFEDGVSLFIPDVPAEALPETLPPWRRDL